MKRTNIKEICWMTILTILCIACFPINPLVLIGLLETGFYRPLFILGWVVWAVGMVLVMAPIVMFPRRGGVTKGKSFVHTTRLNLASSRVDTPEPQPISRIRGLSIWGSIRNAFLVYFKRRFLILSLST